MWSNRFFSFLTSEIRPTAVVIQNETQIKPEYFINEFQNYLRGKRDIHGVPKIQTLVARGGSVPQLNPGFYSDTKESHLLLYINEPYLNEFLGCLKKAWLIFAVSNKKLWKHPPKMRHRYTDDIKTGRAKSLTLRRWDSIQSFIN